MNQQELRGRQIADALAMCHTLSDATPGRDALWLVVQSAVCTRTSSLVTPLGSQAAIAVTSEHATDELIAAMEWLIGHEDQARAMAPLRLFIMMRGVATRSSLGSGRAARADALHGMTNVSPGDAVAWTHPDAIGLAS